MGVAVLQSLAGGPSGPGYADGVFPVLRPPLSYLLVASAQNLQMTLWVGPEWLDNFVFPTPIGNTIIRIPSSLTRIEFSFAPNVTSGPWSYTVVIWEGL